MDTTGLILALEYVSEEPIDEPVVDSNAVGESLRKLVVLAGVSAATKKKRALENAKISRDQADRVLDRTGLKPVLKDYERESHLIISRIKALYRGLKSEPLTVARINEALREFQLLNKNLGKSLAKTTRPTLKEGFLGATNYVYGVTKVANPLHDPTIANRILQERLHQFQKLREQSFNTVALDIKQSAHLKLLELSIQDNPTLGDLIDVVDETLDDETWRVERWARTETSAVYNAAAAAATYALSDEPEFSGILNRWTELVDDWTRRPLDNRVGKDSIVLHGQVAPPSGLFTLPEGSDAPHGLVGRSWPHPPNRPNDRSILLPWMPQWGIPAWIYKFGRQISL